MDYMNRELPVEKRIVDLLSRMTLEEKAAQLDMMRGVEFATKPSTIHNCSVDNDTEFNFDRIRKEFGDRGIGFVHDTYSIPAVMNKLQRYFIEETRLGIPCIFTAEALHGVSGTRGTVFPVPLNLGATFDVDLVKKVGEAIGRETRALGMHEILAPNLDIAREPRWGRVEETFGEDTYLSSRMGVAMITGEQKGDVSRDDAVVSEPKHYCVHGIPEGGTNCSPARVGHREVHSVYLPVFEAGIKEGGAYNVMASYNSIDGDVMMCSKYYLNDILKEQLEIKGYSRSDWAGIGEIKNRHHLVKDDKDAIKMAIANGLDVQGCDYPNEFFETTLVELVNEGKLDIERINDAVKRVLRVKFDLGLFENPYTNEERYKEIIRCDEHRDISLNVARESITLLKNDGVLPIGKECKSIALIGPSSASQKIGGYSSLPTGYKVLSVYDELKKAVGEDVIVRQCDGCAITKGKKTQRIVDGQPHLYSEGEDEIIDTVEEAIEIASKCDFIIMVGGDNTITSGEGRDRCELTLHGRQRELIQKLSELGKPLVLILENGKPVDLSIEKDICNAIMVTWFGGELGAQAIVEAVLGKINPAGRLPISFPQSTSRIPCYYSMLPGGATVFLEGDKSALYPFGFGLSYTTFNYSDMTVSNIDKKECTATISVKVKNTGNMKGDEVVQLYIDDVESTVVTPPMLLKGFKRISLDVGESKKVSFKLNYDSFKLMNLKYEWVVESGDFRILIGSASNDILCETTITL
ncbi:glycoside hydrolase family 3 N-terminal domain-containing protein [Vallitalea longa]|nr:glycoside hydrolase family 3 N-terminal domain-containing protein [Vallitalea longa]